MTATDPIGRLPVHGEHRGAILLTTLEAAVPLRIQELAQLPREQRPTVADVDTVAAHGDDLMYGGRHCSTAFGALVRGLAASAYQPGGVTFAGLHWCTGSGHMGIRHDGGPCEAELERERREGAAL